MSESTSDVLEPPSTSLWAHDYRWRIVARSNGISRFIRTAFGAEAWLGRKEFLPGTDRTTIQISTALQIKTLYRVISPRNGPGRVFRLISPKRTRLLTSFLISSYVANTRDENAELEVGSRVLLGFVFHPVLWDGVSSRIFVGDLLRCVGQLWSAEALNWVALWPYDWGTETGNLPNSLLEACATDVSVIGHDFARTRDGYMRKLQEGASGWGLPSHDLLLAVKHFCGPDYTLTHLGHAAMLLALLRVSPMPPDFPSSAPVVSPMLINGRRYLKGEDDDRRYGSCLASAFVDFAPLDQ
ncbi:hypothetical protein LX32DRAFT_652715 [Colletotrichum zoysiae]|uniref:Uncharacterized protein n=1 Tax=Colletotrichum zoysiae TaxID=1216348 RepID=A0AAD9HHN0_9PEZI|nr:hypothetical protein LX32DRAFT_652715 [Colletotrichum zoysiae]